MHDGFDDDEDPKGQLFYSGIRPDLEKPDYALKPGEQALEGEGPEFEAVAEGLSRRQLLAAGLGIGVACATGGMWVFGPAAEGKETEADGAISRERRLSGEALFLVKGAREAARGPIDDLVGAHREFVQITRHHAPEDQILWYGIARLADYALLDRKAKGVDVARRLVKLARDVKSPSTFRRYLVEMEDLIREWEFRSR